MQPSPRLRITLLRFVADAGLAAFAALARFALKIGPPHALTFR
jgi:hypothetical protein